MVGGETFYPDFTVLNPLNGQEVYIEHAGLDTSDYLSNWNAKYKRYQDAGIREGETLIVTTEKQLNNLEGIMEKPLL